MLEQEALQNGTFLHTAQSFVVLNQFTPLFICRTRSSARGGLVVQRTRTKFGERAFVVAGLAAWNQLPCSIRNSSSVNSFKTALKTFLFLSNI